MRCRADADTPSYLLSSPQWGWGISGLLIINALFDITAYAENQYPRIRVLLSNDIGVF